MLTTYRMFFQYELDALDLLVERVELGFRAHNRAVEFLRWFGSCDDR